MADVVSIGPYQFDLDPRGIRIRREDGSIPGGGRALLKFSMTLPNEAPMAFGIRRLTSVDDKSFDIHGFTTDRIALDARFQYRPEFDGFDVNVQIVNSTEDMSVRFSACLELTGEADPRWLIPGLFYNDNRVRECQRVYPGYTEIHRDPARFLSNHWSFRSDRTAMPLVFCTTYNVYGFLSTEEALGVSRDNPAGLGTTSIGLSSEDGHPRLSTDFPFVEEPVKYSYCRE
ncbi:hypothetical protein HZA57_05545, partial [Candidatus Poribacteria bacterium]|nr:hypothetical protein [Candidatus Poribacteria bacterium]